MRDPYGFITYGPRFDPRQLIETILLVALLLAGASYFAESVRWVRSQWSPPPSHTAHIELQASSETEAERGTNTVRAVPVDPALLDPGEGTTR